MADAIWRRDLGAPRKQRHTGTRRYAHLIDEHAMTEVSHQVLRASVAARKPQIRMGSVRVTAR